VAIPRLLAGVVVTAVAVAVMFATSVRAHHSVSGQFDLQKPMVLTGTVSKVDWINPHIYLHLDVKDAKGVVSTWALATLPTAMMRRSKISKTVFTGKPGEVLSISVFPARDGTKNLAWISKITYADGHFLQLSGS
jgi:hypothetical protein